MYFLDLLKTTLKNMTFKVDNYLGKEGVCFNSMFISKAKAWSFYNQHTYATQKSTIK